MSDLGTIYFEPVSGDSLPSIPMLQDARDFMLKWYNEQEDARFVYHNYNRTEQILGVAHQLAKVEEVGEADMGNLLLAACFVDARQIDPAISAKQLWQLFLKEWDFESDRNPVVPILLSQVEDPEKKSKLANILRDAVLAATYGQQYEETQPLLRLEQELVNQKNFNNLEWNQKQYEELLKVSYSTPGAKRIYGEYAAKYLLVKKNRIDKLSKQAAGGTENGLPFAGLEKKLPNSAIQTFFRTNYRNHINLSAIADTKANIMISVNAILISVVISILSYQNIPETKPMVLLPVVIFLFTGLASLICAVLSIRPKVTALNEENANLAEARKNIVFFGNFVNLSLDEYERAMDAVLRDGHLLYGNMVRDMYHLGKVLDKKYKFLTLSYNLFMLGFVTTVLSFLFVLFY